MSLYEVILRNLLHLSQFVITFYILLINCSLSTIYKQKYIVKDKFKGTGHISSNDQVQSKIYLNIGTFF